jgi:general secretion pathway protein I
MRRAPRAGFTLLEIAVALAVLGVGVVGCLQIFAGSLRLQDRGSRQTRAVLHARAVMDSLLVIPELGDRSQEYTTAEGFHTRVLVRRAGPEEGVEPRPALDFEAEKSLRYLEVDVAWQDGAGSKSYTLWSLRMAPENE